jgi:acetyl-CoA synthetase (ADP-forming)
VEAAGADLLAAARPEDGDVALLVSAMVPGARELIAGFVRDDEFGGCVMLGVGGILAEAVGDVAFRLAPLAAVDADDLIDDLAQQALLGSVRGEPPVDRSALAGILLGLSAVGVDDDRIRSIDLNPLIVSGGVPVAVDALIELDR